MQGSPPLRNKGRHARRVLSVGGEVELTRRYFWAKGVAGAYPVDQAAGIDLQSAAIAAPTAPARTVRRGGKPPTLLAERRPLRTVLEGAGSVPDAPWAAKFGSLRGGRLTAWEWIIGTLSLLIIIGSGLSLLYVGDTTFGSFGDYLSVALWGSTATAGLALLRRLFPGALTTA